MVLLYAFAFFRLLALLEWSVWLKGCATTVSVSCMCGQLRSVRLLLSSERLWMEPYGPLTINRTRTQQLSGTGLPAPLLKALQEKETTARTGTTTTIRRKQPQGPVYTHTHIRSLADLTPN